MPVVVLSDLIYTLIHNDRNTSFQLEQIPQQNRFIAKDAITLIEKIMVNQGLFTLVSGSSLSTYKKLETLLPHSQAIVEEGGIIYRSSRKDGLLGLTRERDIEWDARIKVYLPGLDDFAEILEGAAYDVVKRRTYVRLNREQGQPNIEDFVPYNEKEKNNGLDPDARFVIPQGIIMTPHNTDSTPEPPCLDFMPEISGKKNAAEYLLGKERLTWDNTVCAVDDLNDLGLIAYSKMAFAPGNCHELVRAAIEEKGGYVSKFSGHNGTVDMLNNILDYVRGKASS